MSVHRWSGAGAIRGHRSLPSVTPVQLDQRCIAGGDRMSVGIYRRTQRVDPYAVRRIIGWQW